jgi:hypothetical protein
MLYQLIFILAVACQVQSTLYYVESAPVAPFSCTITHPCRISDLPSSYTTADTVFFVPATTGTSSTFNLVGKVFRNPAVQLLPGIAFTHSTITLSPSPFFNCTNVPLSANSGIRLDGVDLALSTGCNYTASTVTTSANLGTIHFVGGYVSGLTGAQTFYLQGNDVRLNTMTFQSSTSSQPLITLATGNTMSTFVMQNIVLNTITTGSGASAMVFVSKDGNGYGLTLVNIAYNAVVADGALMEWQVAPTFGTTTFYQNIAVTAFTAVGGSCKNGWMYANNNDDNGILTSNIQTSRTDGVNFNGGAAFLLNSNTGLINIEANNLNSNNVCSPTNEANLAECRGTFVNAAFFFSGNDEAGLTTLNCPTSFIAGTSGTVCP